MEKLPVAAAKEIAEKYNLDQVILIARDMKNNVVHSVTYGKSDTDCGMAALDGEKLRRVIAASPASLEDALEVARAVRPGAVHPLIQQANRLRDAGHLDAGIDLIHEHFDRLFRERRMAQADVFLAEVNPISLDTDFIFSVLTATLPAKDALFCRKDFYRKSLEELRKRPEYEEGILKGLE